MPRRRRSLRAIQLDAAGVLLPERSTTVLETVLKPLEVLDIPQQAAFRTVRALEEGRLGALGESTRLSDIAPVERGGIGELVGTIALDPLNVVGGFAAKTAIGATRRSVVKGLKDISALESSLKTAKEIADPIRFARKLGKEIKDVTGTVEEATGLARQLKATKQAVRAQKAELARLSRGAAGGVASQSTLQPDRVLLKLNIPFTKPTLDLVSLDRFPRLLDSSALNKQVREVARLSKKVTDETVTKDSIKLAKLERAIRYQPRGVLNQLSPSLALRAARIRSFLRKQVSERLRQGVNSDALQSLRDIRKNRVVSRQLAFREGPLKEFTKEFRDLFDKSEIDDIEEFNKKIVEGFEFRRFQKEALPEVQKAIDSALDNALDKKFYTKRGHLREEFKDLTEPELQKQAMDFIKEVQPKIALQKDPLLKQLEKIKKHVGSLTKEETMFVNNWGEHFDEILDIEKSLGIDIAKESSSGGWLSYLTRVVSEDAIQLKKKNKALYRIIQSDTTGRLGEAMKRKMFPKMDIVSINEMVREKFNIDFNFFEEDVIKIIAKRFDDHIAASGDAQMAHAMFDIFGIEGEALRGGVSQAQYFKKIGLVGGRKDLFLTKEMERDAQRMNVIVRELNKTADSITMNIVGWVDSHINTFYRGLLTTPFPPFHNRNFIGNVMLNRQAGMGFATQGKFLAKMRSLQWKALHGKLDEKEARIWQELADMRIRGEGELSDIERGLLRNSSRNGFRELTSRPVRKILESISGKKFADAPDVLGINQIPGLHAIPDNPLTSFGVGRGYGILLEEQARGAHYLWKKSLKFSPLESQRSVNKYLFDYSALSPFEKQRLAPLFLFYTWSRKNIPLQLKEMIQNPRFANVFQNITGFDQEDAPLYLRNGVSFPVPGLKDTFVGTLGLPIEDLSFLSVSDTDPNIFSQMKRATERMMTRLAPAFRIPIELMVGKEAFTQRSLRNQKVFANPFKNFREFQNSFLVKNSPFSRAVRTAGDLTDSEDPTASKYLEFILGLRTSRVSKEKIRLTNIKQRLLSTDEFKRPDPSLVIPVQPKEERSEITNARVKALNAALRDLRKNIPRRRRRRRRR